MKFDFKKLLPDVVCVLLFVAISFVYFYGATVDGRRLVGHDHSAANGLSVEMNDYREANDGETPRWINSLFGGMPTFQIAPSYDSVKPMSFVEKIYRLGMPTYVGYILISLLGFYILLRAFDFRHWMAALGAVVWAFSSYFFIIIAAGHIWKVLTLAYIPPTIAGMALCYRGKYLCGGVLTALFATLQILSNHVQMTYYFLIPEILMFIAFLVDAVQKKQMPRFLKATGTLVVAAVIAVGINASNLYHTYEYSKDTMRGKSELVKEHKPGDQTDSGLERSYITAWSYGKGETWSFLIPNIHGGASVPLSADKTAMKKADPQLQQMGIYGAFTQYWGDQPGTSGPVYVGALVCMLFVLGLFIVKGPLKWALYFATVLSICLSWGHNLMWFTDLFIDYVPMYSKFRTVSSILVVAEFTIPLLAMFALKKIVEEPEVFEERETKWGRAINFFFFSAFALFVNKKKGYLYLSFAITGGVALIFALIPVFDCVSAHDRSAVAQYVSQGYFDNATGGRILASLSEMREAMLTSDAWRSFFIIALGFVLIMLYRAKRITAKILVWGLMIICLVDMWQVNKRYLNDKMFVKAPAVVSQSIPKTEADEYILSKSGDGRDYRVLNFTVSTFNDNSTSAFYSSVGGYHAAKLRRYQELVEEHIAGEMQQVYAALGEASLDTLRMMAENAKYPIYDLSAVDTDKYFPVLNMLNTRWLILGGGENGNVKLPIENTTAYGNAWFVDCVKFVDNANEEIDALHEINPRHTAVVNKEFAEILGECHSGLVEESTQDVSTALNMTNQPKVVQTSLTSTSVTYDVESEKGGVVVFSEIYYPGWKATIDGEPVEIARANYVLRAMNVPAGKHKIEMVFDPQSIHTTEAIATTALILLLLGFVFAVVKPLVIKKKN